MLIKLDDENYAYVAPISHLLALFSSFGNNVTSVNEASFVSMREKNHGYLQPLFSGQVYPESTKIWKRVRASCSDYLGVDNETV